MLLSTIGTLGNTDRHRMVVYFIKACKKSGAFIFKFRSIITCRVRIGRKK